MRKFSVLYTDPSSGRERLVGAEQAARVPFEDLPHPCPPVPYKGRRGFVTDTVSANGRVQHLGSLRELGAALLLERDPRVAAYSAGPLELQWREGGAQCRLRPTFLARLSDGQRALVQVPPQEDSPAWQDTRRMLAEAARQAGWQAWELDPPQGVALQNLTLVCTARDPWGRDADQIAALTAQFERSQPLHAGVRAAGLPASRGLDLGYHLLWRGVLETCWDQVLTSRSACWTARTRTGA